MTLNCLVVSFIAIVHSKDLRTVMFHGTTSNYYLVISILACSRLSDSGEDAKEKGREKVAERAPPLPTFLPFYFCVWAFSIQRTRLSRSLEQAISSGSILLDFFV